MQCNAILLSVLIQTMNTNLLLSSLNWILVRIQQVDFPVLPLLIASEHQQITQSLSFLPSPLRLLDSLLPSISAYLTYVEINDAPLTPGD